MKEFKGTKGEWYAIPNKIFMEVRTMEKERSLSINLHLLKNPDFDYFGLSEENKANAKLVAAAPNLLKALYHLNESMKAIKKHYPEAIINRDDIRMGWADEALEKALGTELTKTNKHE